MTPEALRAVARSRQVVWARSALAATTAVAASRLPARADKSASSAPRSILFVAGCPRSGTTWVMSMLQEHPQMFGTRESNAYRQTAALRRLGPRSARAWASLFRHAEASDKNGVRAYADRATLWRLAMESARCPDGDRAADHFIAKLFDHYARAQGARPSDVMVEKTPSHLLWGRSILTQFPSARMIEVVRDGRDVCVSMQMRVPHVSWGKSDREAQIRTWVKYLDEGERLRAEPTLAARVMRVRFEDLKAAPARELARMLEFAGVEASTEEVSSVVAANDMSVYKGPTDGSSPKRRGTVGDWRNHFSDSDIATFWQIAGDAARRAGYES